jgi:hypothetical protein
MSEPLDLDLLRTQAFWGEAAGALNPYAKQGIDALIAEVERLRATNEQQAQALARVAPALHDAESILSLLHHRGLVDSPLNREDVAKALTSIRGAIRSARAAIGQR